MEFEEGNNLTDLAEEAERNLPDELDFVNVALARIQLLRKVLLRG